MMEQGVAAVAWTAIGVVGLAARPGVRGWLAIAEAAVLGGLLGVGCHMDLGVEGGAAWTQIVGLAGATLAVDARHKSSALGLLAIGLAAGLGLGLGNLFRPGAPDSSALQAAIQVAVAGLHGTLVASGGSWARATRRSVHWAWVGLACALVSQLVVSIGPSAWAQAAVVGDAGMVVLAVVGGTYAMQQQHLAALWATETFAAVPRAPLRALVRRTTVLRLHPGQLVQRQGAPVMTVVVVVSGRLEATTAAEADAAARRVVHGAGAVLGLAEALDERSSPARWAALEGAEVLRLSLDALRQAMAHAPSLNDRLVHISGLPSGRVLAPASHRATLVRLLGRLPLLASLDSDPLHALARQARLHHVPAGTALLREGRAVTALHVIVEGELRVQRRGRWVNHMVPGDFFGEIGLLSGAAAGHTVISATPARVASLHWSALGPLVQHHPDVGLHLLSSLTQRLANDRGEQRLSWTARLRSRVLQALGRSSGPRALAAGPWAGGDLDDLLAAAQRSGASGGWRIEPLGLTGVPEGAPSDCPPGCLDIDRSGLSKAISINPRVLRALAHHAVFALPEAAVRQHSALLLQSGAEPRMADASTDPLPTTAMELTQMFPLVRRVHTLRKFHRGFRLARSAAGFASKGGSRKGSPLTVVVKLRKKRRRKAAARAAVAVHLLTKGKGSKARKRRVRRVLRRLA